jgi:hypothetical protein
MPKPICHVLAAEMPPQAVRLLPSSPINGAPNLQQENNSEINLNISHMPPLEHRDVVGAAISSAGEGGHGGRGGPLVGSQATRGEGDGEERGKRWGTVLIVQKRSRVEMELNGEA